MNSKKRTTIIVFTLLLLAVSVGLTAAMMIPNAQELLTNSLHTLETITDGHAVVTVEAELPDQSLSGTVEVWGKLAVGPNGEPGARLEVLDASEAEFVGVTAVTDGTTFWLYDPHSNSVVTGTFTEMAELMQEKMAEYEGQFPHDGSGIPEGMLPEGMMPEGFDPESFNPEEMDVPETPEEAVAKLLEYFTVERDGTVEMGDNNAYQLRLVPIPEQMPDEVRAAGGYINLWLRTDDQLPLGAEYAEGALGSGRITTSVAEINTNFDNSIFAFAIPEGAEVIQAADLVAMAEEAYANQAAETAVEFTPLSPAYLPGGARLAEEMNVRGTAVQRYSLADGKSFYVAQGSALPIDAPAEATATETVTVRGAEATLFSNDDDGRTLLTWSEGELTFWVGGDISAADALAVAESLH